MSTYVCLKSIFSKISELKKKKIFYYILFYMSFLILKALLSWRRVKMTLKIICFIFIVFSLFPTLGAFLYNIDAIWPVFFWGALKIPALLIILNSLEAVSKLLVMETRVKTMKFSSLRRKEIKNLEITIYTTALLNLSEKMENERFVIFSEE